MFLDGLDSLCRCVFKASGPWLDLRISAPSVVLFIDWLQCFGLLPELCAHHGCEDVDSLDASAVYVVNVVDKCHSVVVRDWEYCCVIGVKDWGVFECDRHW